MQDGGLNKVVKPSRSSVQQRIASLKKKYGWFVLQIVKLL